MLIINIWKCLMGVWEWRRLLEIVFKLYKSYDKLKERSLRYTKP